MNCPKCQSEMKLRVSSKTGYKFWGCSKFTSGCKGTLPYTNEVKTAIRLLKSIPNPSHYQAKIFEAVETLILTGFYNDKTNLLIKAGAGSGKTSVQEHIVGLVKKLSPQSSVIYMVYNKHVEVEATSKGLPAKTTHSKYFSDLRNYLGFTPKIEDNKVGKIVKELIKDTYEADKWVIPVVCNIVSKLKNTIAPWDDNSQEKICDRFNIDLNGSSERIFDLVRQSLTLNNQDMATIDYDDMMYLVWLNKIPVQQYDWVLGDECFPYKVPILMKDNKNISIGEIVENKIEGEVLSFNTETGKQEYKKIIGWHKLPNSKQLLKVLALQHPLTNSGHRAWVTCTEDHKIYTKENGWIEAANLVPGYHHIQGETSAKTNQAYKISNRGKSTLAKTITNNNATKKTGNWDKKSFGIFTDKNRGGNGKGLTEPQKIYLDRLGEGWFPEYVVKTSLEQRENYNIPNCYKIDVANPDLKIAIEFDKNRSKGATIYQKKDKVLSELGWKLYRLENYASIREMDKIIADIYKNDCPVWCEVVSVEKTQTKEYYVYDISVEDNHNFYANSVLVHNCQDWSRLQTTLIKRTIKTKGHAVVCADRFQSIYGFRGADLQAVNILEETLDTHNLPLSISYRCAKSHVALVNRLFPEIPFEQFDGAKQGTIEEMSSNKTLGQVRDGDLVLCRTNAPLVKPVLQLIRQGVKAVIRGRDIGQGLVGLIEKFESRTLNETLDKLETYMVKEVSKLLAKEKTSQAASLEDRVMTILTIAEDCNQVWQVKKRIEEIFSDKNEGVVFSTVHKAKGDEAENVFILLPQLMPHKMAQKDWEISQERNLAYVAFTRSKNRLVFVDGPAPFIFEGENMLEEKEVEEQIINTLPEGTEVYKNVEIDLVYNQVTFEEKIVKSYPSPIIENEVKLVPVCPF